MDGTAAGLNPSRKATNENQQANKAHHFSTFPSFQEHTPHTPTNASRLGDDKDDTIYARPLSSRQDRNTTSQSFSLLASSSNIAIAATSEQ
jgi:hypothetical protein